MAENDSSRWRRLPKLSFNSRDLSKRMKKVEGVTVKHARKFVFRRLNNIREVRRHVAIWVVTVGVIIGATGLQLMWYQQGYRTTAYAANGTYAEAVLGPVNTLNPIFASSSAEDALSNLLFSRLLRYDATGSLNYDLAESMSVSDDQKTYTFTIRPDARWQDGIYVRARDVVYTVGLLQNPATRATIPGWAESDITVTAVDDRTVAFRLPAVYAAFLHALNFLPILPEHLLRDIEPSAIRENAFSTVPLTSGPFSLRFVQDIDRQAGRKIIHLARNDSYYRGAPKLDRFQLHVYNNSEAIRRAIQISEVNAAVDLSVTDALALESERYTVARQPINRGVYALFNTTTGALKDSTIRRALQAGTDTALVRAAIGGDTPELYLPVLKKQLFGDIPAAPLYDPAAADRLLNEAGWIVEGGVRMKDGEQLKVTIVTTKNNDFEKALHVIAGQWRTMGITVTTNIVDPTDPTQKVRQDILQPRNYDVLLYQVEIGADPDVFHLWHSSQASVTGQNFANYSNAISDDALTSARSRIEPELRNAKYLTFVRQWLNDAPAIGLYQATAQYVYSKSVHTITPNQVLTAPIDRYSNVLYWSVGERLVQKTP